jgi:GntR family transcriptional regulator
MAKSEVFGLGAIEMIRVGVRIEAGVVICRAEQKLDVGTTGNGDVCNGQRFAGKAIDELAGEHLLVRRQGKGTFVATHSEQQVQFRFLKLKPDNPGAVSQGPAERHIIDCKKLRAPQTVAEVLGLRTGEQVFQVRRVLSFDGVPTIFEDIWLPGGPFKGLTAGQLSADTRPMYAMFESDFGIRMVRAQERLRAVLPAEDVQAFLKVSAETPLLKVERLAFTYQDTPMEWRIGVYLTDTRHYLNELN